MASRWWLVALALTANAWAGPQSSDPVLQAMTEELGRSSKAVKGHGEAPLYYLSYRVLDGDFFNDAASLGAPENEVESLDPWAGRRRILDVSARVGSRTFDNTHNVRGDMGFDFDHSGNNVWLPVEGDVGAIRMAIWRATDRAYKHSVKRFIKVKANREVKVEEEEDRADDFSQEKPRVSLGKPEKISLEREQWREKLKRISTIFKQHPRVLQSQVALQGFSGVAYFADTDGAQVVEPRFYARITLTGAVKAEDGSDLDLFDSVEATSPSALPSEEELTRRAQALIDQLEALRNAPITEPYSGPAIISGRAAAVFFHEIFGHRIEGHRQKDTDEGQTFTKKVGQQVVPPFISVADDPTRAFFGKTPLNGHYQFDDEGVAAQRVSLVENGVLKGFLMGRSPIKGFNQSNGHGRAQAGLPTVARQGNLIVTSTRKLAPAELRAALIAEVKRQNKPYGLVFEDISGGFTNTRADSGPQAFKVIPLVVRRVFPDGRPDQLVRGVDLVGTPLASFEKILATGDDDSVFNGYCGAESGWVPVSAVAPSLLVGDIEVERKAKGHDRQPLLPSPLEKSNHPTAAREKAAGAKSVAATKEQP